MARLEEKIAAYSRVDQRLYEEWHQEVFGEEVKLIETKEKLVRELRDFNFEMYSIARYRKLPLSGAFRWAQEEKRLYESGDDHTRAEIRKIQEERLSFLLDEQEKEDAAQKEKEQKRREKRRRKWDDEYYDYEETKRYEEELRKASYARELASLLEDKEDRRHGGDSYDSGICNGQSESMNPANGERIKLLYRQLARLVHPDLRGPKSRGKMEPWQLNLWATAQEALARGNVVKIEDCLRMAQFRLNDLSGLTIGEIRDSHRKLESEFEALSLSARQLKREVAWNFSSKKVSEKLVSKIKEELKARRLIAEIQLSTIQAEHQELEKDF